MSPAASTTETPVPRSVAWWLFVCCGFVLLMVTLGGVTRLTQSGLSMVEWQPLSLLPPSSEADWQDAFARYQQSPEYRLKNAGMSLDGFKEIFWLEYIHRLGGRMIGVVFLGPFLWFLVRRRIGGILGWKLAGLFLLGGAQGVMGWLMVKSGLADRPDVSQYRLTIHLGLALLIYGFLLWTALGLLHSQQRPVPAAMAWLARGLWGVLGLIVVTVLSGGFVAGLDAGLAYNTFPLMNGELVPDGLLVMEPWFVNLFENMTTVQFQHRLLAMIILGAVFLLWGRGRRILPLPVRTAMTLCAVMAGIQVSLGILTLLWEVPIPLAAAHQVGAFMLFTLGLVTAHLLRR